ncbi:MAG: zinc-binding dehydrogenase [Candidatus Glassbacteria bacterium]
MKAVVLRTPGKNAAISVEELQPPGPASGEVLVRLRWASLNHLDLWVRGGLPGGKYPLICGADGSGEVEELGEGVENVSRGDKVLLDPTVSCGECEYCNIGEHSLCTEIAILGERRDGTFAQYISLPSGNVHRVPEGFSLKEAAAFPLTFVTAWRMLFTKASLREGEWLLIHGIGGGVSTASLILSVMKGAKVIATSRSSEKLEKAKALGAVEVINSTEKEVEREVMRITGKRGVDVVVDSVGKNTWLSSIKSLARGGRLVTCGATTGPDPSTDIVRIFWNQLTIHGSTMGNKTEFREMLDAVSKNGLKPIIDSTFPMDEFAQAYSRMEEAGQFGKILLEIP